MFSIDNNINVQRVPLILNILMSGHQVKGKV
jgi:hypothetical protein